MTVTSRKALIIKLIYALLLPLLSLITLAVVKSTYALIVFIAVGVLFYVPFSINAFYIKSAILEKKKVVLKKLILSDLLFVTLPSILSAVLFEVLFSFFLEEFGNGVISVVHCTMIILISVMNWIMYPIRIKGAELSAKIKKPTKFDN